MQNRQAKRRVPGVSLALMALLASADVSLTGCATLGHSAARAPASAAIETRIPALEVAGTVLANPTALVVALKWERIGGRYPEVVRETTVTIDAKAVQTADVLKIQLPDNLEPLVLQTIERKSRSNGTLVWSASVNKSRHETATITIVAGILTGSIEAPNGRAYRIRHLKGDQYLLQEIDRSKFPPEACLDLRLIGGELPLRSRFRTLATIVQSTLCVPEDPADRIEVMVVFTEDALEEAQEVATMAGAIENAIEQTNTSYSRSGIQQRLVPIYPFLQVQYTEASSITQNLIRLTSATNPQLTIVHDQRKALAADIVVLVTKESDSCGLAKVMIDVSSDFAKSAFAVVPYRCMDSFSFAHELGHLMGARHDVHQDPTRNSPFAYNHGFVQTTPSGGAPDPWFTVMGTQAWCNGKGVARCARIGFWSTPDTTFDYYGQATGVVGESDNRQTLNTTAKTVANFLCSSSREAPNIAARSTLLSEGGKIP